MFDQQEKTTESNAINRVIHLFPSADVHIVSALTDHAEALQRYLAQAHQLTLGEVAEVLDAFIFPAPQSSELSATA